MRILVLGDSVVMPRPRQGQKLSDIWPMLLKKHLPGQTEVLLRARNFAASSEVVQEFGWFSESVDCLDAIVIQAGFVDCPPRPYPYWLQRLILYFADRQLQKRINSLSYKLLQHWKGRPWISPERYRSNLGGIIAKSITGNPKIQIVLIRIGPAVGNLDDIVPGTAKNVPRYNAILEELARSRLFVKNVTLVDPYSEHMHEINQLFLQDGHHLTVRGHEIVAESVGRVLQASTESDADGSEDSCLTSGSTKSPDGAGPK